MNDTEETKPGVYLASFSYGKEEEVAMWTNYGVPKREAVRIRFPMAAMTQWDKANKSGKIVIYVREDDDKNKPFHVLDAKPTEIYFADVAYYGRNDPSDKAHRDGVRYRGMGLGFKEDKWRGQIKKTNDALLFKKRGWAYEHEVRLIVRFNDVTITERHKTIALPFDSLYDAMLADTHTNVMTGPWYDERKSQFTDIAEIRNPSRSSFEGELRMRSNCDRCDMRKNGNECKCPNAEWKLWM